MLVITISKECQSKIFESLTPEQKYECFFRIEEGDYMGYGGIKASIMGTAEEIYLVVKE